MPRLKLTDEHVAWLRRQYSRHAVAETCRLFNDRWGLGVSAAQLRNANRKQRFGRANRNAIKSFSAGEIKWLRANFHTAPRRGVAARFAARFDRQLKPSQLDNIGVRLNLRGAPNTGCFQPGHVPANKGRTGWSPPGSEKSQYRKGHVPANKKPLYAQRWSAHHGPKSEILEINVPETNPYTGHPNRWVRKAVWVWRQAHGDVPPGHVVIQLDGDPANCALENLDCLPRAVLCQLNRHVPQCAGREAGQVRVRVAQLRVTTKRRKDAGQS